MKIQKPQAKFSVFALLVLLSVTALMGCSQPSGGIIVVADTPTPARVQVAQIETSSPTSAPPDTETPGPSPTSAPTNTATQEPSPTSAPTRTITHTPTVTRPPTATPTPTVSPDLEVLWTDDFSLPCKLRNYDAERYSRRCENGTYLMFLKDENAVSTALYAGPQLKDTIVEVEGKRFRGEERTRYGIVIRSDRNLSSFYMFAVGTDGTYTMSRYDKAAGWDNQAIDRKSALVKLGAEKNKLKLLVQGDEIAVYVNDEWLNTFPAPELDEGQVGLIAMGSNTSAAFSNLKVTGINKRQTLPAPRPVPTRAPVVAATRVPQPTEPPVAQNPCQLQDGQSGILFKNTRDFKVLLTIGGGDWGTHDFWFEPNSTTPIQFPPGKYTATLNIPGEGNFRFADDRIDFPAGECILLQTP